MPGPPQCPVHVCRVMAEMCSSRLSAASWNNAGHILKPLKGRYAQQADQHADGSKNIRSLM